MADNGKMIVELDKKRMDAMAAKDTATLTKLLGDDLVYTHSSARLDTKASLALIFKPGFSTHDGNDRDAGRGVGLDFVLKAVHSIGGKISIATTPGKYTRFSIVLPAHRAQQGAVA